MCGICAFIGYKDGFDYCLDGITMLLNRGYDSIGCCSISNDNKIIVSKFAAKQNVILTNLLAEHRDDHKNNSIIIAHSRWGTHGARIDINAHPHLDHTNRFAIVHNGIIENYAEIKEDLINKYNIIFRSQTDTEVIIQLISVLYDQYKNVEIAMHEAFKKLQGTWGVVLLTTETPNKLYCARHGSPLLIGFGDNYMMVASEQSGFCKYVNNYICLNDHDIIVLEKKNDIIEFTKKGNYQLRSITIEENTLSPFPYQHWLIKEINEQVEASLRAMGMGGRIIDDNTVKLGGLAPYEDKLKKLDHLILLGCGSSYHAGLYCLNVFKQLAGVDTVQIFDGAEFTRDDIPKTGRTGLIFLSQSGETKDLYRCIEIGKECSLYMIGVINVVDSLIAREVHCGVYLNAGKEMAVAATKSFMSQVIVLNLIALWFSQIKKINDAKRQQIITGLRRLSIDIRTTINDTHNICKEVAKYLVKHNSIFILGKSECEAIAKEGALKIKEVGYIHTESYNSSSLKHGPYSLIVPGIPVIILTPNNEYFSKNNNIAEELKCREAFVIGISDQKLNKNYDMSIKIPNNGPFRGLLSVIPLQLIAYEIALLKGHNPDFLRNLAKTITVE